VKGEVLRISLPRCEAWDKEKSVMGCTWLSSGFIGRLVFMTVAATLAAVLLMGATAFAQGKASQDQYAKEPPQSESSSALATDAPGPDSTASASADAPQKSPTSDSTASASPDASQKPKSTATGTPPAQTSDTTAPIAPNTSQACEQAKRPSLRRIRTTGLRQCPPI
jgi:cytoskeletal protein RodZ